ncbi:probable nucleoredoxin 1, partial [Phtheirospermum japonicum]
QVKIDSLEGKTVGLYFSASWCGPCKRFTPKLIEVYNELLQKANGIEIVFVSGDKDDEAFDAYFSKMPWLAVPFSDSETRKQLNKLFGVSGIPHLVIVDGDGELSTAEGVSVILEHGVEGYPFTSERIEKLKEQEIEARRNQTLKSLLVSESRDYTFTNFPKIQIPVSDLVGKNILLYFSAHWCPPCRAFLPKLIQAYQEINKTDSPLEVIFISSDRDQKSFDEFFATMPWLAIPFGDNRKQSLSRLFKVRGIPTVIAIGPTGKTVSTEARELIMSHGAKAYPFTAERVEEIEREDEKMAEGLPEKVKREKVHEHELTLTRRQVFNCDGCGEEGRVWSYYCGDCDFDLHLKCVSEGGDEEKKAGEGWVCDGDKCYKEE